MARAFQVSKKKKKRQEKNTSTARSTAMMARRTRFRPEAVNRTCIVRVSVVDGSRSISSLSSSFRMALDSVILSILACSTNSAWVASTSCRSNHSSEANMAYWVCVMDSSPNTSESFPCHKAISFQSKKPGLSSAFSCLKGDFSEFSGSFN